MPVQTTETGKIYFPDGAKAQVKAAGDSVYSDLGALNSAITVTLNYTENQVQTANAGDLALQIRNMLIDGGFTLININQDTFTKMGGGMFENVVTDGTPVSASPDQDIAAGWADNTPSDMAILTSSSDSTELKVTAKPTLTSVTLDPDGTPEVLTEDNDYVVISDVNSSSGWAIQFISAGMTTGSPTTFPIRIVYGTNTPVSRTTTYAGKSTDILEAYQLKFTHTGGNGLVREVELYAVDPTSGGFNFSFKGANEDGTEEMPLTFRGKIDSTRTNGRQLMAFIVDEGAE